MSLDNLAGRRKTVKIVDDPHRAPWWVKVLWLVAGVMVLTAVLVTAGCSTGPRTGTVVQKQHIPGHLDYGQTRYCAATGIARGAIYGYRNGRRIITGYTTATVCRVYAVRSYSYWVDDSYGLRLRDGDQTGYRYVSVWTYDRCTEGQYFDGSVCK